MRPGGFRRLAAAALLLPALAACSRRVETETRSAEGRPALKVVKVNTAPSLFQGPLILAKEEGFFEQEGIDARLVAIDPNSAIAALIGEDLDLVSGPVRSAIFNLILRGAHIRVVAGREVSAPGDCVSQAFTAPARMADEIMAGGTLRGRKFVLHRGGVTEYLAERFLASRGVDRSEVEIAQVPQGEYGSNIEREYEAVRYLFEPQLSALLQRGSVKVVANDEDYAPGNQRGVLVFGKRLLEGDPELGRRVIRAYLRGVARYNEGKTDRNVAVLSRHTKLPPETIRAACWPHFPADGMVNLASVRDVIAWARTKGYVEGDLRDDQWWEPAFVRAARRP